MKNEAILSSDKMFTSFRFNSHNIRFRTSPRLERYTKVIEWDKGYLVDNGSRFLSCLVYLRNAYFTGFRSDQTFCLVS